jgi:hypothetical protein
LGTVEAGILMKDGFKFKEFWENQSFAIRCSSFKLLMVSHGSEPDYSVGRIIKGAIQDDYEG